MFTCLAIKRVAELSLDLLSICLITFRKSTHWKTYGRHLHFQPTKVRGEGCLEPGYHMGKNLVFIYLLSLMLWCWVLTISAQLSGWHGYVSPPVLLCCPASQKEGSPPWEVSPHRCALLGGKQQDPGTS